MDRVHKFFMSMIPPTVTHQEKKVRVGKDGKPHFYEPEELKAARVKLRAYLGPFAPDAPAEGGVRLVVKWLFPRGSHPDGTYRTTKPDTDNLQKLLKDCMTAERFWIDDAQVCCEIVEKFWAEKCGIYIEVTELDT